MPIPGESLGRDPEASAAIASLMGARAVTAASPQAAVAAIVAAESQPYDILICGSLYLAGDVLRTHG